MTSNTTKSSCCIGRRTATKGPRSPVGDQAGSDKYATGRKPNNPSGIVNCRSTVRVSTLNTRTINSIEKVNELVANADHHNICVICIQEHRILHEDIDIKYDDLGKGWTLVTSSAWKNQQNATIGGVGFLLSSKAVQALNNIEVIDKRLLTASFNGNPQTTIISCYSPTNVSDEEDALAFINQLTDLIKAVPKHNVLIVGGDMNAKLSKNDCHGNSYHDETNRNGRFLLDLVAGCELFSLNNSFRKRPGKQWTFTYPNQQRAQLDYILMNRKWHSSAVDCEPYNTFHSVGSDHQIVTARIRLSFRSNVKSQRSQQHDWSKLLTDNDVRLAYTVEVNNRFEVLQAADESSTAESVSTNIIRAHEYAAKRHVPSRQRRRRRVPWVDQIVLEKRTQLKDAHRAILLNDDHVVDFTAYDQAKRELKEAYKQSQEQYVQEKTHLITAATQQHQSRLAWQTVNEISGRKSTNQGKLRAENPQDRLNKWQQHFEQLLGEPPSVIDVPVETVVDDTLPVNTDPFTMDELISVVKTMSCNKATGCDNIPAEVWKSGALNQHLLDICNMALHGDKPSEWSRSVILPFPKKGDLGLASNYRGISLTCISAKIYNKLLLYRIRPHIEPLLRNNQNGFRPNRGTIAQILTLRRIINRRH